MKRIIALIITLILAMTYIPVYADSVSVPGISGWSVVLNNGCNATAEIDYNTGYNGTASLKLVNNSPKASNVYLLLSTQVPVEEGKIYRYGGIVKSDNSASFTSAISWNMRTSLLLFGKTCDFTKYEFEYVAEKTETVQMMFLLDDVTDGIWLDDIFFTDLETGENLIKNPDFDEDEEEETKVLVGENEYQQKFIDINNSEEYTAADADRVASLFYNLPVYYKNITVDADASDWQDITMAYMPIDDYTQLQIYAHDDEKEKDLKIDYALAYDDEYLYMYYNVYDDLIESYADLGTYWRGDSIQFMLSHKGEDVGYEIGLIHDAQTGSGRIFSSDISEEKINQCILSTKREGSYTTYEAAIPWSVKYDKRPDEILFDFIVNDNDYNGRKYCVQLAPGIAEGKTNEAYPTLKMVERGQDWYAWVDGVIDSNINEETDFNLYISNYGEDKTFTVKANGEEKSVTVKKGMGYRKTIPMTFDEEKEYEVTAGLVYEGSTYELVHKTKARLKNPTTRIAKEYQKEVSGYADELKKLIDECESKGISTDYERINWQTLVYFAGFMTDDIEKEDLSRINYTYKQLLDLYKEAKASLEAYLAGEKTPFTVPKYTGDEFEIDGTLTYAETFDGEKTEKRPVFFVGYGHFINAIRQMGNFKNLGVNAIQSEVGINRVVRSTGQLAEGSFTLAGAEATFEVQTEEKHSGERAGKFTNKTPKKPNVYAYYRQNIAVKPNTKYEGSVWVKGINAEDFFFATDSFNERINVVPTEEWQKVEFSFTTGDDQYQRGISFFTQDVTEALYIDDISIKEAGSDVELFYNGGFENHLGEDEDYLYMHSGVNNVLEMFNRAEVKDVSVDLLLSPHYMYPEFHNQYPEASLQGGGFISYDVNHPVARAIVEEYIRYIIPIVREYKALNSICLVNEPTFRTNRIEGYKDEWWAFLQEKHGSIDGLNKAYQTEYKSFEEVEMPIEIGADPVCLDYQTFNNIQFSSWFNWMADLVHELAPEIPLHCKFMTFLSSYEESHARNNITGGYGLEYNADSREINGCDSTNFMTDSAGNKVQTMWYDYQVSVKEAPVFDTEHHIMPDRYDKIYSDEYDAYAVTNVWQGAVHYRAKSVLWAWERSYDKSADYWGLMTQRPKAVWGTGVATLDLNRLSYQIEALQKEKTDVALLYSDATRLYDLTKMNMQYETYNALVCLGKKVRFVTELQAEKMHDFDILFVPGIDYAYEKTLDNVIDYINNGGKVVLIGDNCFKYTEYMNESNSEKVQYIRNNSVTFSGIKSEGNKLSGMTANEYKELLGAYLKSQDKMWVEVVNAETGEICEDIEYQYAIYDGKLIVNVCNYGKTVDINVLLSGEKAEKSVELRSMTEQDDTVTAEQYMPILLEIEPETCFMDTYGHWAENAVAEAYFKNLVSGVSASRFEPDRAITRAEFVTMLIRAAEMRPEKYKGVYKDVDENIWYARYMQAAYNNGIISSEYARPNDYITREEMCDMAVRAYERKSGANAVGLSFTDANDITDEISVSKAYALGIVSGYEDGSFRPKNSLTRAEATRVILNYYNVTERF